MRTFITSLLLLGASTLMAAEDFESAERGAFESLETSVATIKALTPAGIVKMETADGGEQVLFLKGGQKRALKLSFDAPLTTERTFTAQLGRPAKSKGAELMVYMLDAKGNSKAVKGIKELSAGTLDTELSLTLPAGVAGLAIRANADADGGILIDNIALSALESTLTGVEVVNPGSYPLMKRAPINPAFKVIAEDNSAVEGISFRVSPANAVEEISIYTGNTDASTFSARKAIATAKPDKTGLVSFKSKLGLPTSKHHIWIAATPSDKSKVGANVQFSGITVTSGDDAYYYDGSIKQRVGYMIAMADEEVKQLNGSKRDCAFFRIPAMVKSSKSGMLISCFDARYKSWRDLCEDIDVAVTTSSDGGQTWSPLSIAMDTGEGVGNGCGDPCLLEDSKGRLWLQALACHFSGGTSLAKSGTGTDLNKTGQWYMTTSDDGGKSWSKKLINVTKQVKKDEWTLILAGPGSGICLKDGTIVFPAQVWQNGAKIRSRSTICYSTDKGKTWAFGEPLPQSSSECTVVELTDGSIMINARNEAKKNRRVVYTTKDLGKTWEAHETNSNTLQEPTCQGNLLAVDHPKYGRFLLFSNPMAGDLNKPKQGLRNRMTVRVSKDEGKTWSNGYEYDTRTTSGYSSMALVDDDTLGITYESGRGHCRDGEDRTMVYINLPLAEILKAE